MEYVDIVSGFQPNGQSLKIRTSTEDDISQEKNHNCSAQEKPKNNQNSMRSFEIPDQFDYEVSFQTQK